MLSLRVSRLFNKVGPCADRVVLPSAPQQTQVLRRHFFKYFHKILNLEVFLRKTNYTQELLPLHYNNFKFSYDTQRYDKVGAERLCAEWILKCGGRFRWTDSSTWLSDYNSLPPEATQFELTIQDIDVSGSDVMDEGFRHLLKLKGPQSLKIHDCKYIGDNGLERLQYTTSLQRLQISANKNITDKGLLSLVALVNLSDLHLKELPKVQDKKGVYEKIQSELPNCDIIYPDIEDSPV